MVNKPTTADFSPTVPDFPVIGQYQPIYGKFDLTTYIQGASDYEIMAFLVQCYNETLKGYSDVTQLSKDTVTAYNQLQTWVNTWFDELDVQQEINNALQSMYEAGTLASAIAQSNAITPAVTQYLNSAEGTQNLSDVTAQKIEAMSDDGSLEQVVAQTGQVAPATKEFLNTSEGIKQITPTINASVRQWLGDHPEVTTTVQDKSLTINKMVVGTLGYVTPEMFGAKGDGISDDTDSFNNAINFAKGKKIAIILTGEYKLTELNIDNYVTIQGNASKIICNKVTISKPITDDNHTIISNITFDCENGILISGGKNIIITDCTVLTDNVAIEITRADNMSYENIIENCYVCAKTIGKIGILVNTSDCTVSNVNMRDFKIALKANYQVLVSNLHAWISKDAYINGSIFIECTGGSPNHGETEVIGCCIDTYQTGFKLINNPPINITNCRTAYSSSIWKSDITPLLFNIGYGYPIEYLKLRLSSNNFEGFYAKKGKICDKYIYPLLANNYINGWIDVKGNGYNLFEYYHLDTGHLPTDANAIYDQFVNYDRANIRFSITGTFKKGQTQLFWNSNFPNNKTHKVTTACTVRDENNNISSGEIYADTVGVYVTLNTAGKVNVAGSFEQILPFEHTD